MNLPQNNSEKQTDTISTEKEILNAFIAACLIAAALIYAYNHFRHSNHATVNECVDSQIYEGQDGYKAWAACQEVYRGGR